jgi:hypothetical protein
MTLNSATVLMTSPHYVETLKVRNNYNPDTPAAEVWTKPPTNKTKKEWGEFRITLHEGRNRQIRKMWVNSNPNPNPNPNPKPHSKPLSVLNRLA